jgi:hypothetical protein
MHVPKSFAYCAILLTSLGLVACTGDADLSGSAQDAEQPAALSEIDSSGDASDASTQAEGEWYLSGAKAILAAIAPIKDSTIDMRMLDSVASQEGIELEMREFKDFLQRISSGDLGSGRSGDKVFVKLAVDLTKGRRVPIGDLRDLLESLLIRN